MNKKLNGLIWLALFLVIFTGATISAQTPSLQTLNEYVGQYQLNPSIIAVITLEDGRLIAQTTGSPNKLELVAESETKFAVKGQPIKVTFVKDTAGKVTELLLNQNGLDLKAPKISSQTTAPAKPVDKSPHQSNFVTANEIKMNYLDWGGKGEVILLLTGFGNDAHIFDEFAPKFSDKFRVIGLTRRGFGETDKPKDEYDTKTRVDDILRFLDALKIKQAHLVGHSLAGDEMTLFATLYPKRVKKLVYLDAAYNRSNNFGCGKEIPGIPVLYKRLFSEAVNCPNAKEIKVENMLPPDIWNIYVSTLRGSFTVPIDYKKVKSPALSFYDWSENNPEITAQTDPETRKRMEDWWKDEQLPRNRASIEQFRKDLKGGQVVEMKNAGHYLFLGKTADEVVSKTREFLLK